MPADTISSDDYAALEAIIRAKNKELKIFESVDGVLKAVQLLEQRKAELTSLNDSLSSKTDDYNAQLEKAKSDISDANSKADDVKKTAEQDAAKTISDAKQERELMMSNAKLDIDALAKQSKDGAQASIDAANAEVSRLTEEAASLMESNAVALSLLTTTRNELSVMQAALVENKAKIAEFLK